MRNVSQMSNAFNFFFGTFHKAEKVEAVLITLHFAYKLFYSSLHSYL